MAVAKSVATTKKLKSIMRHIHLKKKKPSKCNESSYVILNIPYIISKCSAVILRTRQQTTVNNTVMQIWLSSPLITE